MFILSCYDVHVFLTWKIKKCTMIIVLNRCRHNFAFYRRLSEKPWQLKCGSYRVINVHGWVSCNNVRRGGHPSQKCCQHCTISTCPLDICLCTDSRNLTTCYTGYVIFRINKIEMCFVKIIWGRQSFICIIDCQLDESRVFFVDHR